MAKRTLSPGLALKPPLHPMEARAVAEAPVGREWQYEPKWDGFRCVVFRNGRDVYLQSRSGKPLGRYFPDVARAVASIKAPRFVLDGEIVIPIEGRLSFDELLLRVHPAASRVKMLSERHPAMLVVFDLLSDERGRVLVEQPLSERRPRLEQFAAALFGRSGAVRLSPATTAVAKARAWFKAAGGNLDGIVAKRLDLPYRTGERDGMVKVKHRRTADCVVGGFRYAKSGNVVGSLLLGLYNRQGQLDHVGFTSSFNHADRPAITNVIEPLRGPSPFTGKAPGGPSRWSSRESDEWEPLKPRLVVEVEYDHFTGGRFRHGTHMLRWRGDKPPRECTIDQVEMGKGSTLDLLRPGKTRG